MLVFSFITNRYPEFSFKKLLLTKSISFISLELIFIYQLFPVCDFICDLVKFLFKLKDLLIKQFYTF